MFFQFGICVLAMYISLTRVSDYKHHASDVVAGSVLGVVVAITVTLFLLNLRKYPHIFFQAVMEHEDDEFDGRLKKRQNTDETCDSKS